MGSDNRVEELDEHAIQLIRLKAKQLVGQAGFTRADTEDIRQDLLLDLLCRLPKFNPLRSGKKTFTTQVVNHKVATILEGRTANVRDHRLCTCSLNDQLVDAEGGLVEGCEILDQDIYLQRTGAQTRTSGELANLRIDVHTLMDRLPPRLRDLCERLMTGSISEVARETGIPRATLYGLVEKIRAVFEEAGTQGYWP